MTQAQVANLVGIAPNYYSYIENGKRCEPDKCDTEKAIANVLDFDWTRFFTDEHENTIDNLLTEPDPSKG